MEPKENPVSKVRRRRTLTGFVRSDKMDKTVVVEVSTRVMDRKYKKFISRSKKFKAHDEENRCHVGDKVEIRESRPLSRDKRWVVSRIIGKAVEV